VLVVEGVVEPEGSPGCWPSTPASTSLASVRAGLDMEDGRGKVAWAGAG
jgi:hypothetical protein